MDLDMEGMRKPQYARCRRQGVKSERVRLAAAHLHGLYQPGLRHIKPQS